MLLWPPDSHEPGQFKAVQRFPTGFSARKGGGQYQLKPARQLVFCGEMALEISRPTGVIKAMSVAELKQAVDELSTDERLELAAYLRRSARQDDPKWQAEVARRLDSCLAGVGHNSDEVLALHDRLSSNGR